MPRSLSEAELAALRAWLGKRSSIRDSPVAAGYQGQILLYEVGDLRLVIKEAAGLPPLLWARRWMLRREAKIYELLGDYAFAPHCYGLLDGRYLLLELVEGKPYRHAEIEDRKAFFERFREAIVELHRRGLAHGDLKRKENLLVAPESRPVLLDFGTALSEPSSFAPLRSWLFRLLKQYDVNAWLKLKSNRRIEELPEEERRLYRRSTTEKLSRALKQTYLRLRWGSSGPPKKTKKAPDLPTGEDRLEDPVE